MRRPMQVLAGCLARQQAGEGHNLSPEIGCAISAERRLYCRLGIRRWFLVDVHVFAFCIDARATRSG